MPEFNADAESELIGVMNVRASELLQLCGVISASACRGIPPAAHHIASAEDHVERIRIALRYYKNSADTRRVMMNSGAREREQVG